MTNAELFSPLTIRSVTLRNRVVVSPMCQYSSDDGFASDWHLVHLGSRAVGGAGLVFTEAASVEARGRITPADLGIWKDEHVTMLARIVTFIKQQGAVAGVQIAHAGRKASCRVPWEGGAPILLSAGGWPTVAPSPVPFRETDPRPIDLSTAATKVLVEAFAASARRALAAGFEVLEIHGAHGYLIHEFLSPLSNVREDGYGGSFENRIRFALEVAGAVRAAWPERLPLFMRISCTDWIEGGWDIGQSVRLAAQLKDAGVDLVDCSSGALAPQQQIALGPGYQVPFAERIRRESGVMTGAVGLITEPEQADAIIRNGQADLVLLARAMLRDPYWAIHAAKALNREAAIPVQYGRGF